MASDNKDNIYAVLNTYFQSIQFSCDPIAYQGYNSLELISLTDGRQFILKHLNNNHWLGYRRKEDIEYAECIAQAAEKLNITQSACQWPSKEFLIPGIDEHWLLIPYCKGHTSEIWSQAQAKQVGEQLALLHTCYLPKKQAQPFPEINIEAGHILHKFSTLIENCNRHRLHKLEEWVVSHRDIHCGNVVWSVTQKPQLIDWESVGLIHPFVELVGVAVNAAGLAMNTFHKSRFEAVLNGYRGKTDCLPLYDDTLWLLCLHSWLLWIGYMMKMERESEARSTVQAIDTFLVQMDWMKMTYDVLCK